MKHQIIGVAAVAAFFGGIVGGMFGLAWRGTEVHAASNGANALSVSEIRLVDPQGRVRAQLGFSQEGPPGLFLLDEQGRARLVMGLYPDGQPHVVLNDAKLQAAAILRLAGADSPVLVMKAEGKDRMIMGLGLSDPAKEPFLVNFDHRGTKKEVVGKY